MKKNLYILTAACIAAIGITACGSGTSGNAGTTAAATTAAATTAAATTAAPAAEAPTTEAPAAEAQTTEAAKPETTAQPAASADGAKTITTAQERENHEMTTDISGCSTFTEIVDKKLKNGQGYANVDLDGTGVLLVSDDAFTDPDGGAEAISAEVFIYKDGAPEYAGYVECGGSANPLMFKDGKLLSAGHHYAGKHTITDGKLVTVEEAWETFDSKGTAAYVYSSDDGGDYATFDSDKAKTIFDSLLDEYNGGEIIEFSVVSK